MIEVIYGHDVANEPLDKVGPFTTLQTSTARFEKLLSSGRQFIAIDKINSQHIESKETFTVLTFDDGYQSSLTTILPLLEKYRAPATFFITTSFIGNEVVPYEFQLAHIAETITTEKRKAQKYYETVRKKIKPLHSKKQQRHIQRLAAKNQIALLQQPPIPFLTRTELKKLSTHDLCTIGGHTKSHMLLPQQSIWCRYTEIKNSKKNIESLIDTPIRHFSYPYGGHSLSTRLLCKLAGFTMAFTTKPKMITSDTKIHTHLLPRYDINTIV